VDIRVLATSNRNLEREVRSGNFREDLFFRLNVVTVRLPPLRERPQDIALLAEHFIKKYCDANGLPEKRLSDETSRVLLGHHWRGNVRELENTMHRAVLLSPDAVIEPDAVMVSSQMLAPDFDELDPAAAPATPSERQGERQADTGLVGRTVAEVERDLIIETLHHTLGNRTHAANILGISIRTLRNKLKQYSEEGVPIPMPGEPERAAL
jgi:DNA-binding NtrC family response regulator